MNPKLIVWNFKGCNVGITKLVVAHKPNIVKSRAIMSSSHPQIWIRSVCVHSVPSQLNWTFCYAVYSEYTAIGTEHWDSWALYTETKQSLHLWKISKQRTHNPSWNKISNSCLIYLKFRTSLFFTLRSVFQKYRLLTD